MEGEHAGAPLIVRDNKTAKKWASHPDLSIKLGFAIPINNPNECGLPDPAENAEINAIEKIICDEVYERATGIQVLALTTGKMKEYVFYISPAANISGIHNSIRQALATHEVQCMAVEEPEWDTYKKMR